MKHTMVPVCVVPWEIPAHPLPRPIGAFKPSDPNVFSRMQ